MLEWLRNGAHDDVLYLEEKMRQQQRLWQQKVLSKLWKLYHGTLKLFALPHFVMLSGSNARTEKRDRLRTLRLMTKLTQT